MAAESAEKVTSTESIIRRYQLCHRSVRTSNLTGVRNKSLDKYHITTQLVSKALKFKFPSGVRAGRAC